ncbi:hypothetical protein ACW2Q0_20525 [Nocardia sp. R16R-3T]
MSRTIGVTGEPARRVWSDDGLLEDADSGPVAPPGMYDLLYVQAARVHGVEIFDAIALAADGQLVVPGPMSPYRMGVAGATHPEG